MRLNQPVSEKPRQPTEIEQEYIPDFSELSPELQTIFSEALQRSGYDTTELTA